MNEILKFDADLLEESLSHIQPPNIAYFASSCAERLLPVIQAWRPEIANLCTMAINVGWGKFLQDPPQSIYHMLTTLQEAYEDVVETVPNIYTITLPLAEYAIHSVVCVLQYVHRDDNKYAVVAGRCAINTVDVAVKWLTGIGEDGLYLQSHINASRMVQQELEKQRADLNKLTSSLIDVDIIYALRLESQAMGQQLLQSIQQRLDLQAISWKTVRLDYRRNSAVEGYVQYFDPAGVVVKLDEYIQGLLKFDDPKVVSQKHRLKVWMKVTGTVVNYDDENQFVILRLLEVYPD